MTSAIAHAGRERKAGARHSASRRRRRRLLAAVGLTAQLTLVLTACSEPEEARSFTVPSDLCGTPTPSSTLDGVLPETGENLTTRAASREVGRTHCEVIVDGKLAVSAFSEWKKGDSLTKVARSNPFVSLDEYTSADGTYAWSNRGGVRIVPCPVAEKEHPERDLFVRVLIYDKEFENSDAAKRLLLDYAEAVAESSACTGSAS